MKKALLCALLMILVFSATVLAERQIQEIIVTGQTRTNEKVVLRLLPFEEGEVYHESDLPLVLERLQDLGIFYPMSSKVDCEELDANSVRVIITVVDPNMFYPELISYALDKAFKIVFLQTLDQVIYNPLGNGMNVFGGVCWAKNGYVNLGFSGPITAGWNYTANYYLFRNDVEFTDQQYFRGTGQHIAFEAKNYLTVDWKQMLDVEYYTANMDLNQNNSSQQYLIFKTKTRLGSLEQLINMLRFNTTYLLSLNDNPSSWKIDVDYTREHQLLKSSKVLVSVKGGLSAPETPLNFQYTGGGFTPLPLRGTKAFTRGLKYAIINLEWHQSIGYGLRVVGFADAGKFWDTQIGEIEKSIGIGLAYDSPLGLPLRVDAVRSLNDGSFHWNIGLDLLSRQQN